MKKIVVQIVLFTLAIVWLGLAIASSQTHHELIISNVYVAAYWLSNLMPDDD